MEKPPQQSPKQQQQQQQQQSNKMEEISRPRPPFPNTSPPPPPPLPAPHRTTLFLPPSSGIVNKKKLRQKYQPLYKAALRGDWRTALEIIKNDLDAMEAEITMFSGTVLHVAASAGHSEFVEELVKLMTPEALELKESNNGDTGLHTVAISGQTKAARIMVEKNKNLTHIPNKKGWIPLLSAVYGSSKQQKEMVEFLYKATISTSDSINGNPLISPFLQGPAWGELICTLIRAGYYDIAKSLIESFPRLSTQRDKVGARALEVLGEMPYAFRSGTQLGVWQRCIYSLIPMELRAAHQNHATNVDIENPRENLENVPTKVRGLMTKFLLVTNLNKVITMELPTAHQNHAINVDIENPQENLENVLTKVRGLVKKFLHVTNLNQVLGWLKELIWKVCGIKQVYEEKLQHKQALDLVKCICANISRKGSKEVLDFFKDSSIFKVATTNGTVEIIEECVQAFPAIVWLKMKGHNIFEIAIEERREKIFTLIREMNKHKKELVSLRDDLGNNILHLAAKFSPSPQFHSVSSVAVQMQRELQWFKEVESIALPIHKISRNLQGKTPRVLFIEEHHKLMGKAEKWMKDTANSCMLVAALVATVVFAAAFTVPGGNFSDNGSHNNGTPVFLHRNTFMLFVVADAIALFCSATSVLMFLSILTSDYAAENFLSSLPKRLIIGLASLFLSIASMMIAFCATLVMVVGPRIGWVSIPLAVFASAPVILFALLQFPLFFKMVYSTYGPSIFCR